MKKYLNKNNFFLFGSILILAIAIGLASSLKGSDFLGIFFSIFLLFTFFVLFAKHSDQVLSKIIILAFILRSGLAYVQRFLFTLPDSGSDAIVFEERGWAVAQSWLYKKEIITFGGSYYYSNVISWFYYLFGRSPFVVQFINVLLGTLTVFIIYKTTLVLFNKIKAARIAAGIAAFFPVLNLYSAILLRETFVVFFLALSFYFFAKWLKKGKLSFYFLSLIFIFISGIFHGAIILIGLVYILLFAFYKPREKKWVISSKKLFIAGILLIIIFSAFYDYFDNKIPSPSEFNLEILDKNPRGRAMYLENLEVNNYFDVAWQTPIRIAYFYLAPFPWQLKEGLDLVGFADAFLYFLLFIFCFKSLKLIRKENKAVFITFLLTLVIFSVTFAWGTSNYGTSLRHRQKIVFLLIIMASYYLSTLKYKNFYLEKSGKPKKKVVYFANDNISLYNFRWGLMKEMKNRGYEVYASGSAIDRKYIEKINKDFIFKKINFRRGISWTGRDLIYFFRIFSFCREEKPDICHNFNIKPCIYATLAQKMAGVENIYCTITGLGYAFSKKGVLNKLVISLYKFSLQFANKVIFQNSDDQELFVDLGIVKKEKAILIKSSGVNLDKFSFESVDRLAQETIKKELGLSGKEIVITLIARMLKDKGIKEFIEATRNLKNKYSNLEFLLVGPIDKENPSGFPEKEIEKWQKENLVKYLGRRENIREILSLTDIFVLPSYREGTSRTLLEAGAMELPLVTTDVPGCREVVDDGVNGFLVKPQDSNDLAEKIAILVNKEDLRKNFGRASRLKIKKEFAEEKVIRQTLKVYGINEEK